MITLLIIRPFREKFQILDYVKQGHILAVSVPNFLDRYLEDYNANSACMFRMEDLHVSEESFGTLVVAAMIRKNYSFAETVTVALLRSFEAGLPLRGGSVYNHPTVAESSCERKNSLKERVTELKRTCVLEKSGLALSLEHFRHLFTVWTSLIVTSMLLFVTEIITKRIQKC